MSISAAAADEIRLYAAGSLRGALTDVSAAFATATGHHVTSKFGPSGVLKDEIANGANADVFASANMAHPTALSERTKAVRSTCLRGTGCARWPGRDPKWTVQACLSGCSIRRQRLELRRRNPIHPEITLGKCSKRPRP
jgi:hypothetical protein